MKLEDIKKKLHPAVFEVLSKEIDQFRPVQEKSIKKGILEGKSQLICTPTASGKTLCAEFAFTNSIMKRIGKAVYIVPLKALASEKFRDFKEKYGKLFRIAISIGDMDKAEPYLSRYDLIICTSEKLDSLFRHHAPWLKDVRVVVVDEIHLLNDPGRGPTLEILITLLRELLRNVQILGLSATIGNPKELSEWLDAELIEDSWRPVELKKGVILDGEVEFVK
jgi:helicase